jgi:DNA-binding MarR family transcriptional regulator
MAQNNQITPDDAALVSVLCRLHEWEMENAPELRCSTGRQLYFSVAQSALMGGIGPMVKEVINAKHVTDRALRARLRTMVNKGYVKLEPSTKADRRIKYIKPSAEFSDHLQSHLQAFKQLLHDSYFLIERNTVEQKGLSKQVNNSGQ